MEGDAFDGRCFRPPAEPSNVCFEVAMKHELLALVRPQVQLQRTFSLSDAHATANSITKNFAWSYDSDFTRKQKSLTRELGATFCRSSPESRDHCLFCLDDVEWSRRPERLQGCRYSVPFNVWRGSLVSGDVMVFQIEGRDIPIVNRIHPFSQSRFERFPSCNAVDQLMGLHVRDKHCWTK